MGKNKILYKRNEIGGVNRNDKYGISLELLTNGFKNKINEIKSITKNVSNTVKQNFTDMKNEFSTGFNMDTEKAEQDVNDLTQKLNQAQKELNKLNSARRPDTDAIARMTSTVKNLELSLEAAKADLDMLNNSNMANLGSKIANLKSNLKNSLSFSNFKKNIPTIGSAFKTIFSRILKGSNSSGNALSKMAKKTTTSFKNMLFALVGVEAGLAGLRKAVQSYLSYDQQLSTQLENTWAGLGSVLAPVIQNIINLFSTAVAYVNAFIKALFGIDSVANANAKALANQNKQAKSLTNMDEITNINKNTDSGSGQGLIELPKVSMTDFLNQLVEQIKSGDWYGVGQTIAEKLNETLESIDWSSIHSKASSIGTNVALFLNGGIENTDWNLIGSTIANGLNTAITFSYNFLKNFNFIEFGKGIANIINGFFETTDWSKLGKTITTGIVGILNGIGSFASELDLDKIFGGIDELIENIDWEQVGTAWFTAMMQLSPKINMAILKLCGEALKALALGLLGAFKGAVNTIKNFLGIHSPSTLFFEIGSNIASGVLNALNFIPQKFGELFQKAKDTVINKFNDIGNFFVGIYNKIKSIFQNIGTTVGNVIGNAFSTVVNSIINFAEKTINGFIKAINTAIGVINKIPGVNIKKLSLLNIPRLDVGTNYVPEDQMAVIHKGEAVIPRKFNSAEYFSNINNNDETNALLIEVNRNLLELIDKDTNLYVDGKNISKALYKPLKNEEQRLGSSSTVVVR